MPKENEMIVGDKILPLEDYPPKYDSNTQFIEIAGFEILDSKVIKKYKVIDYEISTEKKLEQKVEELENIVSELLGVGSDE